MPATIVSLLPFAIRENKVGHVPGVFEIPAAVGAVPGVLVIPEGVKVYTYIDAERQSLGMKLLAEEFAKAIVFDWISAQLFHREDAKPGLFMLPGALTADQVVKQHGDVLESYRKVQHKWFQTLVEQGDMEFAKYQSTRSISDIHKHAARALGLETRWMTVENAEQVVPCPACRTLISVLATVCPQCRTAVKPTGK